MTKQSAGILLYRDAGSSREVLLVHPGGPFWAKKDDGAWSIPKGLIEPGEDPLQAAKREFAEETGFVPEGNYMPLGVFRQPDGKLVYAWAVRGDFDPRQLKSNTFTMEWPPRSGQMREFPEVDRAAWLAPEEALKKITKGQRPILETFLSSVRTEG